MDSWGLESALALIALGNISGAAKFGMFLIRDAKKHRLHLRYFFGMNIKHILHIGYHQIPYIATALGTIILYYYLYQATSSFSAALEQSTSRSFWYSSKSSQLCAKVFTKKALQAAGRNVPRMLHGRYEVPSGKLPVCSGKSPSFI